LLERNDNMPGKINVVLLKDFAVLGSEGDLASVNKGYAKRYLIPKGIVKIITEEEKEAIAKEKNIRKQKEEKAFLAENSSRFKAVNALYVYNTSAKEGNKLPYIGHIPPMRFKIKSGRDRQETVAWKWYPTNRLANLPGDQRFVVVKYKKERFFCTFQYLKAMRMRRVSAPMIVDGSNLGWYSGQPSMDPIFYLYQYIAEESEQFFFPLIWAFDKSFKRKLTKTEKREFNEFKNWSGVRVVDYADTMIFKLAKRFNTKYIFSNDHFKEYHTEHFVRISFR